MNELQKRGQMSIIKNESEMGARQLNLYNLVRYLTCWSADFVLIHITVPLSLISSI